MFLKTFIVLQAMVTFAMGGKILSSHLNPTILDDRNDTDYESIAIDYLQRANSHMQSHWMRLRDLFLNSNRKFNQVNHAPLMNDIQTNYRIFATELALNLSAIPLRQLKNNDLRRQVTLLGKLQLLGLDERDYERSMNLLRSMRGFGKNRLVCHYRTDDCNTKVAIMPTVHEVISKTRNLDELEYYWTSWRKEISEMARMSFFEYLTLFRKAAAYNGHITPSRTWHLNYEDENILRDFEAAIMDMMPLYREMHAFMRNVLRIKYGSLISDEDTIPQHLMEQIIQHAWKARSIFSPPYQNRKLPDIKHRMDQEIFTPIKINDMAAEFFQSLGLNHLPTSFWNMYSRKMSDEEAGGPDCKADVFNFPPEVALRYCPKVDFKKFLQMHGHMAELQYNLYRNHLPYGLNGEACPGFGSAIGEAVIVSAGTPRHLEKINLIENYTLDSELSMNRLFRMGVHTILSVPQHFVNEKFFVDALDGRIPSNKLNCGYWKIQDKYAGVSPPRKRTEKQFDPEYKFYKGLDPNKPNTVKLISEILGYQFYRSLCIESGQYKPGDPEYPLHNCDFYGNKKVGELIKDMMTLGSTKHWRDVMQIVTKEHKLSGRGIIEYYQPLYIWLKEQNKLNGISVGWDSYLKCIGDDN